MRTALSIAFGYGMGVFTHALLERNNFDYDGLIGVGVAVACCALAMRGKE